MQIYIDFSVFAGATHAFGRVHGCIELAVLPRAGETISFTHPKNGVLPVIVAGFQHQLKVEEVMHLLQSSEPSVMLTLESVVAESIGDAKKITQYLEAAFGLDTDEYESKEP